VIGTSPTGPKPRFLAAGDGSVWTLNQGDGSVTRIDASTRQVSATIPLGLPRSGGDIAYGEGLLVVTQVGVPITAIDARSDKPLVQGVGPGGDSLRIGHGAIWLTDYLAGTLIRIDPQAASAGKLQK
jgi:YVTN family beta-propeller protein